ncbi:MAG: DNA/RNA nuclease SfsA [Candidatus Njordarchaeales archaeon]
MIKLLEFSELVEATFLHRPNRFLVKVIYNSKEIYCHLHNPGRLSELLVPRAPLLILFRNGRRKTLCDVIAVKKDNEWIFTHSGYHSLIARRIIELGLIKELRGFIEIVPEYKFGSSRIDFLLKGDDEKLLLEVKGCTLFRGLIGYFPDAPTARGTRHLIELIKALGYGMHSGILFLVMKKDIIEVRPNWDTDPRFAEILVKAYKKGVKMFAHTFYFDGSSLYAVREIKVNPLGK